VLECVVNVSEGTDSPALRAIAAAAGDELIDLHHDPHHNRAVLTLAARKQDVDVDLAVDAVEHAARRVAAAAMANLDLRAHRGVHPRIGVVDVVPFVPLDGSTMDDALRARDRFAVWAGDALALPCFLYGPERSLPEVRRGAFGALAPDTGPPHPHPTAGACAVGARPVLVAYNLWLATADLEQAAAIARTLRGPHVRALAFPVGDAVQVSTNLLSPLVVGPEAVYDQVAAAAPVVRAELVGLLPRAVLATIPPVRWQELDLAEDRTIEARLAGRA